MGFNTCPDCGNETGNPYMTAHESPFDCIKELKKEIGSLMARVARLEKISDRPINNAEKLRPHSE
jgi:uncharacterized protein (UPF0212 family)